MTLALPYIQMHSVTDLDALVADSCHSDMYRQDWQARWSLIVSMWSQLRVQGGQNIVTGCTMLWLHGSSIATVSRTTDWRFNRC